MECYSDHNIRAKIDQKKWVKKQDFWLQKFKKKHQKNKQFEIQGASFGNSN